MCSRVSIIPPIFIDVPYSKFCNNGLYSSFSSFSDDDGGNGISSSFSDDDDKSLQFSSSSMMVMMMVVDQSSILSMLGPGQQARPSSAIVGNKPP